MIALIGVAATLGVFGCLVLAVVSKLRGGNAKIPLLWAAVCAVLVILMASFDAGKHTEAAEPPPDAPEAVEVQEPAASAEPAQETELDVVKAFVSKYNLENETGIHDVSEIDIHDKSGRHYRTEFRLPAYKNAVAKRGYIGDVGVDMVHFGFHMKDFRVYSDAIGDMETAYQIFRTLALAMDSSIPEADFQKVHDSLVKYGEELGTDLGDNVRGLISKSWIHQTSFWGIMLDSSTTFQ